VCLCVCVPVFPHQPLHQAPASAPARGSLSRHCHPQHARCLRSAVPGIGTLLCCTVLVLGLPCPAPAANVHFAPQPPTVRATTVLCRRPAPALSSLAIVAERRTLQSCLSLPARPPVLIPAHVRCRCSNLRAPPSFAPSSTTNSRLRRRETATQRFCTHSPIRPSPSPTDPRGK